jgi:hypothetical protein
MARRCVAEQHAAGDTHRGLRGAGWNPPPPRRRAPVHRGGDRSAAPSRVRGRRRPQASRRGRAGFGLRGARLEVGDPPLGLRSPAFWTTIVWAMW